MQDKREFKDGENLQQQATDQLWLDNNTALHKPFGGDFVCGSVSAFLQCMLPWFVVRVRSRILLLWSDASYAAYWERREHPPPPPVSPLIRMGTWEK